MRKGKLFQSSKSEILVDVDVGVHVGFDVGVDFGVHVGVHVFVDVGADVNVDVVVGADIDVGAFTFHLILILLLKVGVEGFWLEGRLEGGSSLFPPI